MMGCNSAWRRSYEEIRSLSRSSDNPDNERDAHTSYRYRVLTSGQTKHPAHLFQFAIRVMFIKQRIQKNLPSQMLEGEENNRKKGREGETSSCSDPDIFFFSHLLDHVCVVIEHRFRPTFRVPGQLPTHRGQGGAGLGDGQCHWSDIGKLSRHSRVSVWLFEHISLARFSNAAAPRSYAIRKRPFAPDSLRTAYWTV